MKQTMLRAVVLLAPWAIGLLVAAWIVPGVSVSALGFIVAVLLFSIAQATVALFILRLPRAYASLLLGAVGLLLTLVALGLASALTHGLSIHGVTSWLAATIVVWLVTTVGAIALPEPLVREPAGSN
jgi:hypothetical protein